MESRAAYRFPGFLPYSRRVLKQCDQTRAAPVLDSPDSRPLPVRLVRKQKDEYEEKQICIVEAFLVACEQKHDRSFDSYSPARFYILSNSR